MERTPSKLPEGIQAWSIDRMIEKLVEYRPEPFSADDLFIELSRIGDHLRSLKEKGYIQEVEGASPKMYTLGQCLKIERPARIK